ncbi:hypothetical protein GCM10023321_25750 [Pseudonocardia eucalypti]|uniref:Uncharacterized protein n=1 Tax=Pseudonocardia eucalypti TaxID=648755 RepID=A0ABP9Q596_9PSEU
MLLRDLEQERKERSRGFRRELRYCRRNPQDEVPALATLPVGPCHGAFSLARQTGYEGAWNRAVMTNLLRCSYFRDAFGSLGMREASTSAALRSEAGTQAA